MKTIFSFIFSGVVSVLMKGLTQTRQENLLVDLVVRLYGVAVNKKTAIQDLSKDKGVVPGNSGMDDSVIDAFLDNGIERVEQAIFKYVMGIKIPGVGDKSWEQFFRSVKKQITD